MPHQFSPRQFQLPKPRNPQQTILRSPVLIAGAMLLTSLLSPPDFTPLGFPSLVFPSLVSVANAQTTSKQTTPKQKVPKATSRQWLNHYLPEDRPRIAGGIWKFLSTDTDRHYHRPDSAFMLNQSPDQIIGFASAADAQEAGYEPGPSVNDRDRQSGHWSDGPSSAGGATVGVRANGGNEGGNLNLRIPASQIPRDVYVIIQATDILADAIDKAADSDTAGAIYRMLRRMRQGSQNYIDLSAVTGNKAAFADATRWYPILQMLEQGATAKMNRGGMTKVNEALSRQSTRMARNSARMLIPQVKAAINRGFTEKVRQEGQRMLRR